MFRLSLMLALFISAGLVAAQDKKALGEPQLVSAVGSVDKAGKDVLTIRPRGADGKFQKAVTLKVTGTSKVSILIDRQPCKFVISG